MLKRITKVKALADYHIRLDYEGGETIDLDMREAVHAGGVLSALADPDLFGQVSLGSRGRAVCWPGEIEFCADALWLQAHQRATHVNP